MSVDDLPRYLKEHWPEIRAQLVAGTYRPQPVKRVMGDPIYVLGIRIRFSSGQVVSGVAMAGGMVQVRPAKIPAGNLR